jgi:hypothetical protein
MMSMIMPATEAMAVGDEQLWTIMDAAAWMADCYPVYHKDVQLL